jgi:hypothetical protein
VFFIEANGDESGKKVLREMESLKAA